MSFSSDEEGFEEKVMVDVYKEILSICAPSTDHKKRIILRSPRCIYPKVPLCRYPPALDQLPRAYSEENIQHSPLVPLACLLSSRTPMCQISDLCRTYSCVYNKLNENLAIKHDMTIYLRHVKTAVMADMMRPFDGDPLKPQSGANKCQLSFHSNYEGGNLHSAFKQKAKSQTFFLCLQNDTNTHGYNQWFNFTAWLENSREAKEYEARFVIVNHSKDIKYDPSMRILTCENVDGKAVWSHNVPFLYYANKFSKYNGDKNNSIDFKYTFKKGCPVTFCLSLPYPYSKLVSLLTELKKTEYEQWDVGLEDIGKSEGNNHIYMVRLTRKMEAKRPQKNKKCVVIIARQHASEAVSSILCEQIIRAVLSSTSPDSMSWFFVPMSNPDGVIHGNSRTNLKGYDINRCWTKETMHLSSEVECINEALLKIKEDYTIEYLWDLHGHTKEFDSFAYFCQKTDSSKLINCLLSQKTPLYNFYKSRYGVGYKKRPTFRGQMFYRERIRNVITLEVSHFGFMKEGHLQPLTNKHFQQLSRAFVQTLQEVGYLNMEREREIFHQLQELEKSIKLKYVDEHEADSDSDPEGDYLLPQERRELGFVDNPLLPPDPISSSFDPIRSPIDPFKTTYNKSFHRASDIRFKTQEKEIRPSEEYEPIAQQLKPKPKKETKRKPIYTSSYVEISPYYQHIGIKPSKRYSHDPISTSNEFLRSRRQQAVTQSRTQSRTRKNFSLSKADNRNSFRTINGQVLKSSEISVYPTESNLKINLHSLSSLERAQLAEDRKFDILESKGFNFRELIKARAPRHPNTEMMKKRAKKDEYLVAGRAHGSSHRL